MSELTDNAMRALRLSLVVAPAVLAAFEELRMDTPEDEALRHNLLAIVTPWSEAIEALRTSMDEVESAVPAPGTPATYRVGSDTYAMTICGSERNGRTLLAQFAHRVTDALGENPSPEALAEYVDAQLAAEKRATFGSSFYRFTLRTDGRYRAQGAPGHGDTLAIGKAVDYRDPSF